LELSPEEAEELRDRELEELDFLGEAESEESLPWRAWLAIAASALMGSSPSAEARAIFRENSFGGIPMAAARPAMSFPIDKPSMPPMPLPLSEPCERLEDFAEDDLGLEESEEVDSSSVKPSSIAMSSTESEEGEGWSESEESEESDESEELEELE